MIPQQWASPCGNQCTQKYAALMQIPWRVFCKKGCDADGETWEEFDMEQPLFGNSQRILKSDLSLGEPESLEECNEICYKDPVLKDQQWSAYIDRSPGAASYSEECFHACVAGCGYKFDIPSQKVDQVNPNRPKPPPEQKPPPPTVEATPPSKSNTSTDDILSASA